MHIVAGIGELGPSVDDPSTDRLNHPTNVTFDPMGAPDELVHRRLAQQPDQDGRLGTRRRSIDVCGTGKRGFAGDGGPAADGDAGPARGGGVRRRRQPADRRPGQPDDPQGRSRDRHHHHHRRHRALRRRGQPEPVRAQRRRPGDGGRVSLPDRPGGDAGRAHRARRRRQHLRRRHRELPRCAGSTRPASIDHRRRHRACGASRATAARPRRRSSGGSPTWRSAPDGRIYIADTDNSCVRVVTPDGIIATFAGQCGAARVRGRRRPAGRRAARSPVGRRDRTRRRALHRRHAQPAGSASSIADAARRTGRDHGHRTQWQRFAR